MLSHFVFAFIVFFVLIFTLLLFRYYLVLKNVSFIVYFYFLLNFLFVHFYFTIYIILFITFASFIFFPNTFSNTWKKYHCLEIFINYFFFLFISLLIWFKGIKNNSKLGSWRFSLTQNQFLFLLWKERIIFSFRLLFIKKKKVWWNY